MINVFLKGQTNWAQNPQQILGGKKGVLNNYTRTPINTEPGETTAAHRTSGCREKSCYTYDLTINGFTGQAV